MLHKKHPKNDRNTYDRLTVRIKYLALTGGNPCSNSNLGEDGEGCVCVCVGGGGGGLCNN